MVIYSPVAAEDIVAFGLERIVVVEDDGLVSCRIVWHVTG